MKWQDGCGLGQSDFKALTLITARQYVRNMQKYINELDGWRDDLKYRSVGRLGRNEYTFVYRLTNLIEMKSYIPFMEDVIIWHELEVAESYYLENINESNHSELTI